MRLCTSLAVVVCISGAAALAGASQPGAPDDDVTLPGPVYTPPDPQAAPGAAPIANPIATQSLIPAAPVTEVDRSLEIILREERDLKRELEGLGRESELSRARTIARGRAYVRLARAGLLPVGGGFEALVDHATKVERLRRALGRDLGDERRIASRRVEIGKRLEFLATKRAPLEVQQRALAQARDALLTAQDRALAFQRAFESSGPGAHTAVYGAGVGPTDPAELASGFAAMKGRLPFPIPGRAELKSSRRPGADGPGLEMRAPRGTPVRAVYAGRVAFADEYSAYGKTVILDHGEGYYTVSANLSEISLRVGEDVTTGTRIGSVGDMGQGAMLYFEIRHRTATVDPAEWFGI